MDDVIGQGREPERDPRVPMPRRWRVAAGTLAAVAAGLAVVGVGLHHGTGSPGSPATTASAAAGPGAGAAGQVPFHAAPDTPAPAPQNHAPTIVCAPSAGTCSMRVRGNLKVMRADVGA